jgi:hypothetical protein
MVQRTKRSMSPAKAREMQAVTKQFHHAVRTWSAEVPTGCQVYIALDVLNFALHLANSQFNREMDNMASDPFSRLYRSDVDAGEA